MRVKHQLVKIILLEISLFIQIPTDWDSSFTILSIPCKCPLLYINLLEPNNACEQACPVPVEMKESWIST